VCILLSLQLLVATFFGGRAIDRHAIYISTIKIHHEEASGTTSIQLKIFSDDLQNDIKHKFSLGELPKKSTLCEFEKNEWIQQYFAQHLMFWVDDRLLPLQLSDCRIINDVHLISFFIHSPTFWKTLRIKADYLMELYPTQSNVLQLYYTKKTIQTPHSYFGRMTNGKEYLEFSFPKG